MTLTKTESVQVIDTLFELMKNSLENFQLRKSMGAGAEILKPGTR